MGLIDSLRQAFGAEKASDDSSVGKVTPTGYEISGTGYMDTTSKKKGEYLQEMKGWVGAATTAIADEVASIELKLYQVVGDDEVEEVTEHPVLDLLFRVNGFTTKFDHFWLTQSFLELTGEAPWFLEREGGEITNIFFLLPDRLTPITGKSRMIEGYKYHIGPGQTVKLEVDEVIFLKYPDPAKPFRGIGTLEMAAKSVDIDNFSENWNAEFYKNSARPDSILKVNTPNMDQEQKDKLRKSFEKLYKGGANAHKNMLLFGDMEFTQTSFAPKDMEFLEQQNFSRDKILGIFRVPKAIVAQTEGVNFASSKTAEYIFARYTIKPKMERLTQQLNEFLLPMFAGTENMFIDYTSPVPADEEKKISKYNSALQYGWMTINEVRTEQGLEPVEGGDEIMLPNHVTPIDDENRDNSGNNNNGDNETRIVKAKRVHKHSYTRIAEMRVRGKKYFKQKETRERIKRAVKKALIADYRKKQQTHKVVKEANNMERRVLTESETKTFWEAKNAIYHRYLEDVQKNMIKLFKAQRRSTLLKIAKVKKDVVTKASSDDIYNDVKLDEEKEVARTLAITFPTLEALFIESGNETFELLQAEAEMNTDTEEIQTLLRSMARDFAEGATESTNEFIRKQIEEGLSLGESIPQLRDRIINVFNEAESFRAERIARTETARYNVRATEQAFIDSGLVEAKVWVTDPDPCPYCAPFAGKVLGLGKNFANLGDTIQPAPTLNEDGTPKSLRPMTLNYEDISGPPLHPNCQCDLKPIFLPTAVQNSAKKIITVVDKKAEQDYINKSAELNDRLAEIDSMEDATTDELLEATEIKEQLAKLRDELIDKLNTEYEQE